MSRIRISSGNSSMCFWNFVDHWQAMSYVRIIQRRVMPVRAAKMIKSTLQYLNGTKSVHGKTRRIKNTYFSPF